MPEGLVPTAVGSVSEYRGRRARMHDFTDKIAVVTGGASGIGRALAEGLISRGAQVVIADVEQDRLEQTARETGATGIRVDVSDRGSVQALADDVAGRFGR